ncbi:16936_t:CDS:1, partial [Dentiscutata erythropus]
VESDCDYIQFLTTKLTIDVIFRATLLLLVLASSCIDSARVQ